MLRPPISLFSLVMVFLYIFFAYHALTGERSLMMFWKREIYYQQHKKILDKLRHQRATLERQILLMGDPIDPDVLDEQVRQGLGYKRSDELMVILPCIKTPSKHD